MPDTSKKPEVRNYLARREQRRLLLMALLLGSIILLAVEARKPERWDWLWAAGRGELASPDTPTLSGPVAPGPAAPFPGVQRELFETVLDGRPMQPGDRRAWLNLLDVLNTNDQATLEAASEGHITFLQLDSQPAEYRGSLVTLHGRLHRVTPMESPPNEQGIGPLYKLWFQPSDRPDTPIVIHCLELPDGFPSEISQPERVSFTGFFFKRTAYAANDEIWTTPLLLAKTFRWQPRPETPKQPASEPPILMAVFGAVLLAAAIVALALWRTRGAKRSLPETVTFPDEPGKSEEQP